jgi:NAD(P)H-dependent FMN reductase
MPRLAVIVASTRPGRIAPAVAEWFVRAAREHGGFEVDLVDLAEVDLPFLDEPNHPRLKDYVHDHTRAWSARVDAADAFVVVTPEYNYGMPAVLKNALDYLHHEWAHKPIAFVSYGGVSAGTRSVQMAKQVVTTLRMYALPEAVSIPFVQQFLDDEGRLQPNETMEGAAKAVLDELVVVEQALRPLRERAA